MSSVNKLGPDFTKGMPNFRSGYTTNLVMNYTRGTSPSPADGDVFQSFGAPLNPSSGDFVYDCSRSRWNIRHIVPNWRFTGSTVTGGVIREGTAHQVDRIGILPPVNRHHRRTARALSLPGPRLDHVWTAHFTTVQRPDHT